ncbi:MAG: MFS transporter, partial [Ilumatobacteraceae bacterium]
ARAVAQIIWVGALGAVIGPLATPLSKSVAVRLGLNELTGPYLLAAALFVTAGTIITFWLRPDPLTAAGGVSTTAPRARPLLDLRRSAGEILSSPFAVLGLAAMTVSQATMVAVMMMTPPHMDDHGHADLSAMVIAVHIFGMFGLSPLVGRLVDRIGPVTAIRWGAVVLGSGTAASVVAGYVHTMLFLGLFLLGLGWSIGLIAGSTLLTSSVPEDARVAAQGTGDLTMSFWGATAAFGSGFIKSSLGFHMLANAATAAAAVLLLYAWVINANPRSDQRSSTRDPSAG